MFFNYKHLIYIVFYLIIKNYCQAQYSQRGRGGYGREDFIPLGLFIDRNNEQMGTVFDHAIEAANTELETSLTSITREVPYGDSFQGFGQLCNILQSTGLGAVLGPSSKNTAIHLMTVCDAKDIPYFYPQMSENSEGFNLYPHPLDMATALHSIITAYEWSRFIFLYESAEYLTILNGITSLYVNNTPIISVQRYDLNSNGNYKDVLRRIKKSSDNRIVVVGSTETMPEFLKQALQVGIINEDYKYIVGNLDFHSFDLEEYKYSESNITSLRLFSPEQAVVRELMTKMGYEYAEEEYRNGSCPITMEMALTYDAIQLFAETTKHLQYHPEPLNCSDRSDSVREDGSTFKNYMRTMNIMERTLTGNIYFEGNIRKGYTFEVIELQPSGLVSVGFCNETNDYIPMRLAKTTSLFNVDTTLANKTFIVLLLSPNKPYASIVESHEKLEGNDQYEGYVIDLVKELSQKLGFNYTFINAQMEYGTFNKTTNESTGMLREIREKRADLIVTDLTITAERQEAVDFSVPFMNLGIAILHIQPQKAKPELFTFMDPFASEIWICLGLSFVGISLSFFILGRLSPSEWDNLYPCVEEPTVLENQFTLGNSFWFTTGALLQQGSEFGPRALSTRTVASFWWFFTLIIVSSYTANLAAFLTIENPKSLIENVKDLAENKNGIRYGSRKSGATRNFFMTSPDEVFKKMNEYMNNHPELLFDSNVIGVEHVKNNTDYAFLMESTSIEYNTKRECNLTKIGDTLDEKGYGIAMIKGFEHRDKFNNAILELQEQNILAKLKNKWWNEAGVCASKSEKSEASELNMENLKGVYLVLVLGSIFSIIIGFISWVLVTAAKAKRYGVPFKAALKEEFAFVLDFNTYTRIIKSSASVYSRSRQSSVAIESLDPDSNT